MNQPGNIAQTSRRLNQRLHGFTRGDIDRRHADLVSGVGQNIGSRLSIFRLHIGQHDMLADTDPPRNCLPDLTGPDDDNYIFHAYFLPNKYCASVTCSIQLTTLPSSISAMAMCVMAVVGVAPCQCLWFGGYQTTSPARISSTGPPSHWVQPTPAVTISVVRADGCAMRCARPARK
jgi:hypothetical protein